MDNSGWHKRFLVQAKWTEQLRRFVYQQIGITAQSLVLEVGCGTGVITSELKNYIHQQSIGIDIDFHRVKEAVQQDEYPLFSCADAYQLPFPSGSMDFVVSHFLFLWLKNPASALKEMLRVLKPGGLVVALAEPDHLARIDNPKELWELGAIQTQALIKQGANPMMGRMLPEIFSKAGVSEIQYGISGFQASPEKLPDWFESEWVTLQNDLQGLIPIEELKKIKEFDIHARSIGSRVLWVPTFYSYGKKTF